MAVDGVLSLLRWGRVKGLLRSRLRFCFRGCLCLGPDFVCWVVWHRGAGISVFEVNASSFEFGTVSIPAGVVGCLTGYAMSGVLVAAFAGPMFFRAVGACVLAG